VFAFETPLPKDPTRPITSFKTAWIKVRQKAAVKGRWHDNRHTLVTELAESGAGDEVIMSIAGHVSRAMLSRYSHVRMEAKRRALDEIAARQRAADEKRQKEAERQRRAASVSLFPPRFPSRAGRSTGEGFWRLRFPRAATCSAVWRVALRQVRWPPLAERSGLVVTLRRPLARLGLLLQGPR
jgi:hypothetical protein